MFYCFFFQAEDGIRDGRVTGVQTCALPIWKGLEKYTGIKQKRRRLFGDECFPAGTLVDTPNGRRRIEDIRSGDEVINIGRASCRDRVSISVVGGALKKKDRKSRSEDIYEEE